MGVEFRGLSYCLPEQRQAVSAPTSAEGTAMKKLTLILLSSFFALGSAYATEIPVASYSMNNGAAGSYDYRDFTYVPCNGVCDVTNAPLSGGAGKLTDGVLPSTDWNQEGYMTQWVGWDIYQGGSIPQRRSFSATRQMFAPSPSGLTAPWEWEESTFRNWCRSRANTS